MKAGKLFWFLVKAPVIDPRNEHLVHELADDSPELGFHGNRVIEYFGEEPDESGVDLEEIEQHVFVQGLQVLLLKVVEQKLEKRLSRGGQLRRLQDAVGSEQEVVFSLADASVTGATCRSGPSSTSATSPPIS